MRFAEFLTEAFDKPYPYEWTHQSPTHWGAKFKSGDATVEVDFVKSGSDTWEFAFARNKNIYATGTGDQYRIFATVIAMIQVLITELHPKHLEFSSFKSAMRNETGSRAKLYTKMCNRFAEKNGYSVKISEKKPNDEVTITDFILTRKE